MLGPILILLFLILLVIIGYKYDIIVPPVHQFLKNIDSIIFDNGKKPINQKVQTYKVGVVPKITLIIAVMLVGQCLYTGNYGFRGGPVSFSLVLAYLLYVIFLGIYKIEVIDEKYIKFFSIVRNSIFNLSEILEVNESMFKFNIKFENGSVAFNNYSDEYRNLANIIKSLKRNKEMT